MDKEAILFFLQNHGVCLIGLKKTTNALSEAMEQPLKLMKLRLVGENITVDES